MTASMAAHPNGWNQNAHRAHRYERRSGIAYGFSLAVVLLAMVASATGLFAADLYRDNDWTRPQLRGNDLVTLFVAAPLLAGALLATVRGSLRGRLLWLGTLGYMLYNYLFYAVGAAYNLLFLVYVGVT